MDDIGVPVCLKHEFQRGLAEKSKPLGIVMMAVKNASVKEILVRVGFYEKTLKVVCEAKVHIASKVLVVKGNPEIAIDFVKIVDAIIAHAIVFGQHDLHGVPADRQFMRKPLNDIS